MFWELWQFFCEGLTKNSEIGNTTVWVLSNIWRLGWVRDTKFGSNASNEKLINAVNCQVYSFYCFWVIKGKPREEKPLIFWKQTHRKKSLYFRKRIFLIFWERYIRNPSIFRTLVYSEPDAYLERCQTSMMQRFAKIDTFSIFEDFSKETARIRKEKWKEVLKNRKDGKISYLQYKTVICKEQTQVS